MGYKICVECTILQCFFELNLELGYGKKIKAAYEWNTYQPSDRLTDRRKCKPPPGLMDIGTTLLFTVFLQITVEYSHIPPVFAFGGIFDTMQLLIRLDNKK